MIANLEHSGLNTPLDHVRRYLTQSTNQPTQETSANLNNMLNELLDSKNI
jgi:hypothetical protein